MKQVGGSANVEGMAMAAGAGRPGPEMGLGMTMKELKYELDGLKDKELNATSVVELRGIGAEREYAGLIILKDDKSQPRCPNEKLPMKNRALKTMVDSLLEHYGKKAEKKELAFLKGGFNPPGFTQVTLQGTGLGLYFDVKTGEPMGKLTGKL